jgi:prepilin-type N-terminal cleavage/methylation domain-containing protein
MNSQNKKGFTLIELLVVISIIALLSSVIFSSINNARIKSRDTQRVAQIRELQKAIEHYVSVYGEPPVCDLSKNNSGYWCGSCDKQDSITKFKNALQPLVSLGYISEIPIDPIGAVGSNCMNYEYYTMPDSPSSSDRNKWTCGTSYNQTIGNGAVSIVDHNYAIRFSTERTKFSGFLNFVWNRSGGGQEYCVLGQKKR